MLVVALCLGWILEASGWTVPEYCHGFNCPEFSVLQKYEDFEARVYADSRWITTKVPSADAQDVKAGNYKLYNYCLGDNEAGTAVPKETWPALITITEGEDGSEAEVSVSWFVAADTVLPKPTDPSITEESRPAATVYVRVFSGNASNDLGRFNVKQLREALVRQGESFKPHRYTGAVYENPWDIFHSHHNEVWLYAA